MASIILKIQIIYFIKVQFNKHKAPTKFIILNYRVFLCEDQLGHQIALKAIKRNLLDDKYYNSYKTELNALKRLQTASSKTNIQDEENTEEESEKIPQIGQLSKRSMSFDQDMCFIKEQNSQLLCQDHEVNVKSNII